jgi:hypothetical protein
MGRRAVYLYYRVKGYVYDVDKIMEFLGQMKVPYVSFLGQMKVPGDCEAARDIIKMICKWSKHIS